MNRIALVSRRPTLRRLTAHQQALDGLRGVAVLLVIGSHLAFLLGLQPPTPWLGVNRLLQGGFIGVDIFFVLIGFLITSLILAEIMDTGQFSLRRFYIRRALRLLPALYVLLAIVFVVSVWNGFPIASQWEATRAALLYIINWFYALPLLHDGNLEVQTNIGHLWSLAIEEQFYLIWPVIFALVSRRRQLLSKLPFLAVILIIVVVVRRYSLLNAGLSTWNIFMRTDARVDSILIGSLLAFIYMKFDFDSRVLKIVAYSALVSLVWFMYTGPSNGILFKTGFTLIAICAAVVILASVDGSWWLSKVLSTRLLSFVGRISYGLYLWHFPIFDYLAHHMHPGPKSIRVLVALSATFIATITSWRFIETPCLRLKDRQFASKKSPIDQSDETADRLKVK